MDEYGQWVYVGCCIGEVVMEMEVVVDVNKLALVEFPSGGYRQY